VRQKRGDHADLLIEALDRTLEALGYDEDRQMRVVTRADGREVLLIQANRFSVSRIYVRGRPDGKRIEGHDCYFDLVRARWNERRDACGSDAAFELSPEEWRTLFAEAADRYVRYLLFAGIQRWNEVEGDTRMNLDLCDFARRYAPEEIAWSIYQYKGYILMMNSIAQAELAFRREAPDEAQQHVARGIERIGAYCRECLLTGHPEAEAVTREHYLANILKYREELVLDGRLPDAAREDPTNIV
jgi:hypothetical protein